MEVDRPIAIATTLFVILIVIFYLVMPKYQEVKGLQSEILIKEAELTGREKYFREIANTYQKLVEHRENVEKINTALPEDPSIPPLVYFLEDQSLKNGLILENVELLRAIPSEEKIKIKQTRLLMELHGSYSSFRNFLASLENSSRLIEVENILFTTKREKGAAAREEQEGAVPVGGIHEFRLNIKVYSY